MRIDILLVIAAVGSALPFASRAQDTGAARACATIEADQDRLACYDRALRIAPSAAEPAAPAAAATAAAAGATTSAPPAAETKPTSLITPAPRTNVRNSSAAPAPAALQPGTAAAVAPSQEQVAAGIVPIIVLSTRTRPGHGTEFTTDQGKVWIQRDTQPLALPPTPFKAQLTPGALGGFFLVPENRAGIRVRQHE